MSSHLTILTSAISIVTFLGGCLAYYRSSVEKNFADTRDFNHVKNNQQQLSQNLQEISTEMDSRFDDLKLQIADLKGLLYAALGNNHRKNLE